MDLLNAKVTMICNKELNDNDALFADELILEKNGERFLVESCGSQLLVCKMV